MITRINADQLSVMINPLGRSPEIIRALSHRLIDAGYQFTYAAIITVTVPMRSFREDMVRLNKLNAIIEEFSR